MFAFSLKAYVVGPGDTLSEILLKKRSDKRQSLYGGDGLVAKTVELNNLNNNGNKIYPGMTLQLPFESSTPLTVQEEKPKDETKHEINPNLDRELANETPAVVKTKIFPYIMPYTINYNSSGVLGTVQLSGGMLWGQGIRLTRAREPWSYQVEFRRSTIDYGVGANEYSVSFYKTDILFDFKTWNFGIAMDEFPIFRLNSNLTIDHTVSSHWNILIGKRFMLSNKGLNLSTLFSWAVLSSARDSSVSLTGASLWGAEFRLYDELLSWDQWAISIEALGKYKKFNSNISWSSRNGKVETNYSEMALKLGAEYSF